MKRLSTRILVLAVFAIMMGTNISAAAGGKESGAPANSATHNQQSTNTARDAGSGKATGKRQYAPLKIKKEWGTKL
jgi:hypothetical protein